jgi:hypothetical protein
MMRRLLLGAIGLPVSLLLLCLAYSGSHHADRSHYEDHPSPAAVEAASSPIYFSPSTNLEEVDIALIERARRSIDVAMYTFHGPPYRGSFAARSGARRACPRLSRS